MARTIKAIQDSIIESLYHQGITLSNSKSSEGRTWTFIVATAIYLFEIILDLFRKEVDALADKITPGTVRWYVEQCKRWQNGHELLYNPQTTELYYKDDDPESRLIDVVAITEGAKMLSIKVAKTNKENKIEPLTDDERYNFMGYMESIKFAGTQTECISTTADQIKYIATVYHTPTIPQTIINANVAQAIDGFRQSLDFNSMFYRQRFIDVIMRVEGIVTVDLTVLNHRGASQNEFIAIGVMSELDAGYFDFTDDSDFTCKLAK